MAGSQNVHSIVLANERTFVDVNGQLSYDELVRRLDVIAVEDDRLRTLIERLTRPDRRSILGLLEQAQMEALAEKKSNVLQNPEIYRYVGLKEQQVIKEVLEGSVAVEDLNEYGLPEDLGRVSTKSRIEEIGQNLTIDEIPEGYVLLQPLYAGLCVSDVYYWKFEKSIMKLTKRVPVIPLHEGVCEVVDRGKNCSLEIGALVVINPLQSKCDFLPYEEKCSACRQDLRNLCTQADFMGSTADGLARSLFLYPEFLVYPVLRNIPLEVAAVAEPLSIAHRAIHVAKAHRNGRNKKIAVIGSGTIGYNLAVLLSKLCGVAKENLFFIGRRGDRKLAMVADFTTPINNAKRNPSELATGEPTCDSRILGSDAFRDLKDSMDLVFECAGGDSMKDTVNQGIKVAKPGTTIIVLGLNDQMSPVRTIDVVNKGLTLRGVSRSKKEDYECVLGALDRQSEFLALVREGVKLFDQRPVIKTAEDLQAAFEFDQSPQRRAVSMRRVVVKLDL